MRVLSPVEAAREVVEAAERRLAHGVLSEVVDGTPPTVSVRLRPGVRTRQQVRDLGLDVWQDWADAWRDAGQWLPPGARLTRSPVGVEEQPDVLHVTGLDTVLALARHHGVPAAAASTAPRLREVARSLHVAGARLSPATLEATAALDDDDVVTTVDTVRWLAAHPVLGGWALRQLPIPGVHTKWVRHHGGLIARFTGRRVQDEVRPRPAVAHLTYLDPAYRSTGGRVHDAWTTGDHHALAYRPDVVLVVENRDCRLWFPPVVGGVVVEGSGRAATSLLAGVPWVREAPRVVYWGDIDAAGFAILDHLRAALRAPGAGGARAVDVQSILMDGAALARYAHLGVTRDENGKTIPPSTATLRHLTPEEASAYAQVATAGPASFRRIEQELVPLEDARLALLRLVGTPA